MASEYEIDDTDEIAPVEESPEAVVAAAEADNGHFWGSIVTGALIGLVVGGGLALLFAPKRGTELRSDLGGAVDDLRDRAEKVLDDLQDTTSGLLARSREMLDQTRENLVRSVEVGREAYTQKKEELTSQLGTSDTATEA